MTGKLSFKIVLKRLFLILGIVFLLGLILGIIYQKDVKEWILDEIQSYISEIQSGDLEIEEIELALFHNLPDVSVRLKNVNYYEHKDSLRTAGERPILYAETLNLSFEPWELIRNQDLIVSSASIAQGSINFIEYDDKKLNLQKALQRTALHPKNSTKRDSISKTKPQKALTIIPAPKKTEQTTKSKATPNSFEIDLKEIELSDIRFNYQNLSDKESAAINISSLTGELSLNPLGLAMDIKGAIQILNYSSLPMIADLGPTLIELNLDFIDKEDKIIINKGHYEINGITVNLKGNYIHTKGRFIDMQFDAAANDMAILSTIIQDEVLRKNEVLLNKADIVLKGKLTGQMTEKLPKIDLEFGVKDLSFSALDGQGDFKNVRFSGEFHSGEKADYSMAMLEIRDLNGQLPGGSISGHFHLNDFVKPYLKYDINATLSLNGYDNIFQIPEIDSLKGRVSLKGNFDGLLDFENEHKMDHLSRWTLSMEDIGFKVLSTDKTISRLNGIVEEAENNLFLNGLGLDYDGSEVVLNGEISNFYHFIFNKENDIEANMDISSAQFYTKHFVLNPEMSSLIDERVSDLVLKAKVSGRNNDSINSYLPWFTVNLEQLSFKLDTLVDLPELQANIELYDTKKGLRIDLKRMHANMPKGSIDLSGNVVVMDSARLLDAHADMIIDNIPESYLLDLIYEMKGLAMMSENEKELSDHSIYSGNLHMSGIIETLPFAMQKAQIKESTLTFRPPDSLLYELKKVNLNLDSLYFLHEEGSNKIVGIKSVKGNLELDELNTPIISKVPLNADFSADNDQIQVNFSILKNRTIEDSGSLILDVSNDSTVFEISYNLSDVPIESVVQVYFQEKLAKGILDVSFQLEGSGIDLDDIIINTKGSFKVKGDSLTLYGIDVDKILKKYKRSQNFNLVDIGAFMLAGPVGAVVTKGGDFVSLIGMNLKAEDSTHVSQAIANWRFQNGIIETEDVAFNTPVNRFAFDGKFDIANDSIPGFSAYVLDKNGCSLMEQQVSGKLDNLQVGKLKIAKTLLGSVINFVNSVVGVKCEPVYQGAVQHPIPIKKSN